MRIDDLRTTLNELADEADDLSLPERLRGIDRHTRRDRRRRRLAGAAAAVVALAAVGAAVTVVDDWRTDSGDPIERPEPKPDPHAAAKVETITDNGVTIQVDPGDTRLAAHHVGTADEGVVEFQFTPKTTSIEYDLACTAPSGSPYTDPRGRYWVSMTINGVDAGGIGSCDPTPQVLTPSWQLGGHDAEDADLRPGESAAVRVWVVDNETGEVVTDPDVSVAAAVYDTLRADKDVDGVRFERTTAYDGYNYRLIDERVVRVDGTPRSRLGLHLAPSDAPVLCELHIDAKGRDPVASAWIARDGRWHRLTDGQIGGWAMPLVDTRGEPVTVEVRANPPVTEGTFTIAVYELAD